MLLYIFLLFTLLPIVELSILIWIGVETEWWIPVLLIVVTGVAGVWLARWQGWCATQRIRQELHSGQMPADSVIDAVLIFFAGLLLIAPGILSDLVGVLLLFPPTRRVMKHFATIWFKRKFEFRADASSAAFWEGADEPTSHPRDQIIDVKVLETHIEDDESPRHRAP